MAMEMNESYRRRKVKGFKDIKEELVSIRRERYGRGVPNKIETENQEKLKNYTHKS